MGDGMGHAPPPPPPPPPTTIVVEVRAVTPDAATSADGAVLPAIPVRTEQRANSGPVATGVPPAGGVVGVCDRCGATGAELVAWRVQITTPPEITLRGVCRPCATATP